jgi:teichuronic acid biosynthesis glycosyltransferase TuaG
MNPIQISILIPIYNGIEFLHQSIGSVLSQTYSHWEVILGINGHPAESEVWEIAKNYSVYQRIRVLDMVDIKGKSNALNEMVKHATYNWIAILDVDDIWYPTKLEKQLAYLEKYDVVGTKCVYFGDMNNIVPYIPNGDLSSIDFFERNPIINSSAIIKKELCHWEENGLEDYDLWLRLKRFGYSFYNVDEVLVLHRIHLDSAFNSKGNNMGVPELLDIHRIKYHITTEYYGDKFLPIVIPATHCSIAGGFFVAHSNRVHSWAEEFDATLRLYWERDRLVKDDQIIIADCLLTHPEKCVLYTERNPSYDHWFQFQRVLA